MYSLANTRHDNLISNLESTFSKSFHIEDAERSENSSVGDDYCDTGQGSLIQQETTTDDMCLRGSADTSYFNPLLPLCSSDDDLVMNHVIQANIAKTHLKPVSAMKGSRGKQGGCRTKLTVKWAPDVYDPLTRSLSHSYKSKRQYKSKGKKSEKKNGMVQKNTYNRRVSGKGKKQYCESIGTSDKCCKLLDSRNGLLESSTELDALDSHEDSFCGTSFIKQSVTLAHYSFAEA
ncbi:uncharacterized protein LOC129307754 [Prosopis cineraria]|uniref:uncharacterized protein LOC129307754 n=1 Tax=Prosopis cineraria TaxID=364024 RepID=UPI00240F31B4|nr:uncharacterized protein LOC129307754 [Prosopis cineraria]XP_054804616.1 uncharacterized protein LOC129307754 [Prosopis cineraria]